MMTSRNCLAYKTDEIVPSAMSDAITAKPLAAAASAIARSASCNCDWSRSASQFGNGPAASKWRHAYLALQPCLPGDLWDQQDRGRRTACWKAVAQRLQGHPLLPYQKILALTFMHASRRRLDAEFRANPFLRGKRWL